MLTLENLFIFMLLGGVAAWLWHSHGIRERALAAVRQYCKRQDVEWLDENVAFRRLAFVRDRKGRRRLARIYGFEFTVTGEQRHQGSVTMFGPHPGHIELEPHPFDAGPQPPNVIQLDERRRPRD
ncbi:DUF3301 domain-containing protein [Stutzerimonas kirkiae]|uniref:DUF3301 domain-containing protein n=1 Tax=Stutzerimonas kirkiae TaxID=2211392 RepID=A0A4Q9RET9_9GAMM|nr:DUF3301 domain-containing protein [Stutzerimonas kirkiae]TBU99160.1 DUF3301 domain-containing protein [Stutzerimonas kirkiae]TBV06380.1 DUF3301 domain-containing protein [Stutzerimonas kirkiae]TBV07488.1 DUF3301 domain-containing protein [Stutzerimonas kirkiae]TBV15729.1 DUF3301 domain-containing protein [Stutzerimonas kirkiae]